MEKAVRPVGREGAGLPAAKQKAEPGRWQGVAFQVESGEKYVGIRLQSHGIFLNVLFKHIL